MPIHDWTRVTPADSHDMHLSWLVTLRMKLHGNALPAGFYGQILSHHASDPLVHAEPSKGRQRTIGLFRDADRQLVAVIEQTTRRMLATPDELGDFTDRVRARLRLGIHTLVISIHPPTPGYSPDAFDSSVGRVVNDGEWELVVSSFDTTGNGEVRHARFTVLEDIPCPPLRLSANVAAVLPLQSCYDEAFASLPHYIQARLSEVRALPGNTLPQAVS